MTNSTTDEANDSAPDPAEVAARRVGELFAGKWLIERVLGSGGMATVYAATHTNNQRSVALKVLHAEFTASGDIKKRFLREGFIANRIGHTGAVAILDDGVDDAGNVFLVMELLTGASVADRIRAARGKSSAELPRRAFDQAEALRVADGVLDVLAAAHAQGIVHRDLKPDNVFVTDVGEVKVLDFGISRLREPQSGESGDAAESNTRTGVLLGTPQYMPPEQARGRSSLVDERSDLWAVGAIVFAMLTGRHVHEAETPNEALLKAMTATARPLGSVVPDVNAKLAAVVDRALSFDQDQRYPDARAMQADVKAALASVGSGSAELAPMSGSGIASGPKPVTSVTRSAMPIVRDTHVARSGGWRVISVVVVIVLLAIGGRAVMARFAPRLRATQDVPVGTMDAGAHAKVSPAAPLPAPILIPDAAAAAIHPEGPDASAAIDSGLDDAEAEDEDDDGGDDEDEVTPAIAAHGGHAAIPARHPGAPPHKGDKSEPRKKKKKKKRKPR